MGDISLRGKGIVRKGFASGSTPAWQRKEGKSQSGGLNKKGIASYRAAIQDLNYQWQLQLNLVS
jgi:hypothetical protein